MLVHSDWLLTPQRAAIHVPTATAVVADLHLGYDEARRRSGEAVPDAGLEETVASLSVLFGRHDIRRLVVAGDLAENAAGRQRVQEFVEWLADGGVELAGVVPGNHDQGLSPVVGLPLCPEGFELGCWRVVHGHGRLPAGQLVLGHFHPCLRWPGSASVPCFLVGPRRMVLPAFSADAAGVNVLRERRWGRYRLAVISGGRVLEFGASADRLRRRIKGARRDGPHAPPAPSPRPRVCYQYRSRHQS